MAYYFKNIQSFEAICFQITDMTAVGRQDRRFCKVFMLITKVHADCFAGGEFKTIVGDPILHTVYSQLHKSLCMWEGLCNIQRAKSCTNNDASEPFKTDFTILLILRLKRTGYKMLPWGTPISCSYVPDRVDPALTWNSRWDRNPSMKVGK